MQIGSVGSSGISYNYPIPVYTIPSDLSTSQYSLLRIEISLASLSIENLITFNRDFWG